MQYLIDGHNLIPQVPGLSLSEIDDEAQLIHRLQVFCQQKRCSLEVYFDNAPPGFAAERKFGRITAHFVRQGTTADAAIQARLLRAGKAARNLHVVSSDRQVQAAARAAHAGVISSEDFARELVSVLDAAPPGEPGKQMSGDEIAYWEKLFKGEK